MFTRFKNAPLEIEGHQSLPRRMLTVSFKISNHQRRLNSIIVRYTI